MRYRPDGLAVGLDYAGVDAELRNGRWPRSPRRRGELWAGLQIVEREFVAAAAEQQRNRRG